MFFDWSICINFICYKGGRIYIVWKFSIYEVIFIMIIDQFIYYRVKYILIKCVWECIVVYGFNYSNERLSLWGFLYDISDGV